MTTTVIRDDSFTWVNSNIKPGTIPLIITDPPYGSIINAQWDLEWNISHQWLMTDLIRQSLCDGGTAYVFGGIGKYRNRIFFEWLSQVESDYHDLRIWDVIVWGKRRAYGTKNKYLFTREEICMLVKGEKPKTFNVPLLETERAYSGFNADYPALSKFYRRSNVWSDINELFRGKIHPTEKPSRLAEIMIETSSNQGDMVLDMFAGSGSTGVAANKLGRDCILIEKSDCPMRI